MIRMLSGLVVGRQVRRLPGGPGRRLACGRDRRRRWCLCCRPSYARNDRHAGERDSALHLRLPFSSRSEIATRVPTTPEQSKPQPWRVRLLNFPPSGGRLENELHRRMAAAEIGMAARTKVQSALATPEPREPVRFPALTRGGDEVPGACA